MTCLQEDEKQKKEKAKKKMKERMKNKQIHRALKAHLQELVALGVSEVSGLSQAEQCLSQPVAIRA
jgi:hypothetical protein